jgi:peroxiredoxin Q/BCP
VGQAAPPFKTKDHRGKSVQLAEWQKKRVVLWFYPKADTPGCTKEGCGFRDLHAQYKRRGILVFGVSYDTPEENAAFAKKFDFPFALLSDPERTIAAAYGALDPKSKKYPRRNTIVIGPDGKVEHILEGVDPKTHPKELLERLSV